MQPLLTACLPPVRGMPHAGEDVPAGLAAVGWRVGVYWNNDTLFYYGDIIQHEPHTNRHGTAAAASQLCCVIVFLV